MRVLFAGTPATALPGLARLLAGPHEVVAVLTRPPRRRVGTAPRCPPRWRRPPAPRG